MVQTGYTQVFSGKYASFDAVLGETDRVVVTLIGLFALPTMASLSGSRGAGRVSRFLLVAFVILFNPLLSPGLARWTGDLLAWRIYWALPFAWLLAMSLVLGVLAALRASNPPGQRALAGLLTGCLAVAFVFGGPLTWQRTNRAQVRFGGWRVEPELLEIAERVRDTSDAQSLALMDQRPGHVLPLLEGAPPQVSVRNLYLVHLERHFGKDEVFDRKRLFDLANTRKVYERTAWAVDRMDQRCVDHFVVSLQSERKLRGIRKELQKRGFEREVMHGFALWRRTDRSFCK
jgi:hypothetical protein